MIPNPWLMLVPVLADIQKMTPAIITTASQLKTMVRVEVSLATSLPMLCLLLPFTCETIPLKSL